MNESYIYHDLTSMLLHTSASRPRPLPADTAREAIIAAGDKALVVAPVSIMDKEQVPPSGQ
jgi:hypothetical protein